MQSEETLNDEQDEVWWLDDAHLIAISLICDIAIFSFSTVLNTWLAFNEAGANGYIYLLNSVNHIEVLHGKRDTTGSYQSPVIPRTFQSQRVSRALLNWSEAAYLSIESQYSHAFVWPWPQYALNLGPPEQESTQQTNQQVNDAVFSGYYCDVAGCPGFGPVDNMKSVKIHKLKKTQQTINKKKKTCSASISSCSQNAESQLSFSASSTETIVTSSGMCKYRHITIAPQQCRKH